MKITKILPVVLISSALYAQNYFIEHGDLCRVKTACPNETKVVSKLQSLLGLDIALHRKLKVTGKFDRQTFDAVVAFQKQYGVHPADGWVGRSTKVKLDKVYGTKAVKRHQRTVIIRETTKQKTPASSGRKVAPPKTAERKWTP